MGFTPTWCHDRIMWSSRTLAYVAASVAIIAVGGTSLANSGSTTGDISGLSQIRIMPLGDSVTAGEGSSTGDGYRWHLARYLTDVEHWPAEWVGSQESGQQPNRHHEGHSGWRIDQLAGQIAGWIRIQDPDVVLVHAGINDALQGASGEVMLQRMALLVKTIVATDPTVEILIADLVPVRYGTDRDIASISMQRFNRGLHDAVATYSQVTIVHWSRAIPNRLLGDGIHPTDEGYLRAAWVWYRCLGALVGDGVIRAGEDPLPVPVAADALCE